MTGFGSGMTEGGGGGGMDPLFRGDDGLGGDGGRDLSFLRRQESIPLLPCSARAQRSLFNLFF